MNFAAIETAEAEAQRFLECVERLRQRLDADKAMANSFYITGCKESGALRRASMDLTRALTEMRKRHD